MTVPSTREESARFQPPMPEAVPAAPGPAPAPSGRSWWSRLARVLLGAPAPAHIKGYRPDVDGLRAVAVLSVLVFHVSTRLLPGGFVGVDIFFVISGYLISGILFREHATGRFSFGEFYGRRIRRLGPALIVVLAAVLALGWFLLLGGEYKSLGRHTAASALFANNILLYSEVDYFDTAAEQKPLLHLWSLGIEEQFYLFWPLLLWLGWKRLTNLTVPLIACIAVSFALCAATTSTSPSAAFYLPHTRYWELLVGALIAYRETRHGQPGAPAGGLARALGSRGARQGLAWGGLAAIVVALFALDGDSVFPGWWAAVPVAGAAALISAGPGTWLNRHLLGNRAMTEIGMLAYPIYLWHWPLLVLVRLVGPTRELKVLAVVATLVLAWLTKVLVEDPLRFGSWSKGARRHATAVGLFALLFAIGGLGFVTDRTDGFLSRFPPEVRPFANYATRSRPAATAPDCFLDPAETARAFPERCAGVGGAAAGDPLLLLWGDSFAAHLLAGLEQARAARPFALAQYTASACPPVVDVELAQRQHCRGINQFVLDRAVASRPHTVVLAANWLLYGDSLSARVGGTIRALRAAGVKEVVLVGPISLWRLPLPALLARTALRSSPPRVPTRLPTATGPAAAATERLLREVAAREQATYVSAVDALCTAEGCLTTVPGEPGTPMQFDIGHFTSRGSEYFVQQVERQLIRF